MKKILLVEQIEHRIHFVRGHKVMLDRDLAQLYGVKTKVLNKAVRRNIERFPEGFMFQVTTQESENLRFQIGTSSSRHGGRRYLPLAFTEQGVAMLSSVLRSKRAIQVNIAIMKTFVKLRQMLAGHRDLAQKLEELEKRYDAQFREVFEAIRQLMKPAELPHRRIGFHTVESRQYKPVEMD
ncbi:MAG: ORF6N domain-containing protein [Candidatus Omnitrophica bacterium]|nr:ORF6N domain-containing protein [Candidatus Omnitrophota bacterium]